MIRSNRCSRSGSLARTLGLLLLVSVNFLGAQVAWAIDEAPSSAERAYRQLLEMAFSGPYSVPAEGIVLEHEGARWTLSKGTFWIQDPVLGNAYTGIAFTGAGRYSMAVPDQYELHQLRRYARREEMESVDSELTRLYLRSAAPEISQRLRAVALEARAGEQRAERRGSISSERASVPHWVRERRNRWILHGHHDADARILGAFATFGERYLRADMKLIEHGWLTYSYDARRREEIELLHPTRNNQSVFKPQFMESWLRLDRPADRQTSGRPGAAPGGFSRLRHLDLDIDLTRLGENPATGFGDSHPIEARVDGVVTFEAKRDGLGALVVRLDPRATDVVVESRSEGADGTRLPVLRYPRGELANHLEDQWGIREFVVLLDAPASAGERVELQVGYDLELVNYAPGLGWHPTSADFEFDPFTASLAFTTRSYYEVRASGRRLEDEVLGKSRRSRWEVETPSRIVGFTFARYPHSERFEWPGLRPLTIFATTGGYMSSVRIANLGRFFEDNLRCLSERFGSPPAEELTVTLIAAGHSQAFPGFIQVTESLAKKGALGVAVHGTKELLAAHELAHQWWGHKARPASQRDVWLSESLAEYSAALCVRDTVDDGERVFDDIVEAFTNEMHGDTSNGFNPFARLGLTIMGSYEKDRLPPISHGHRGALTNNPWGSLTTLYRKGAMVLHMASELLRVETGDDDAFDAILLELLGGGESADVRLRTEDLEAALSKASELDWSKLFDQWVRRPEVPAWRVSMQLASERSLAIDIDQRGVGPEFQSWVPVRAELADGSVDERLVLVDADNASLRIDYPQSVLKAELNPNGAVPVRLRGRSSIRR